MTPPSAALDETAESVTRELESEYGAALAAVRDEVVGCVLFRPEDADLYFGRLSVIPQYRGAGLAGALVHYVEAEAAARGCPGVVLGVRIALPDNQRLFQHLRYVEVARHAHPGFREPTWIEMRKEVRSPDPPIVGLRSTVTTRLRPPGDRCPSPDA